MLTLLAHAGHVHTETAKEMTMWEHSYPVIISAAIIIIVLLGVITYLLIAWQPKSAARQKQDTSKKK